MDSGQLAVLMVGLPFYVYSLVWSYRDATRRGKPPWTVVAMIAFATWPASLLIWLVFRPEVLPYIPPED